MKPYFFVSHAEDGAGEGELNRFVTDLRVELLGELGYPTGREGEVRTQFARGRAPQGFAPSVLDCHVFVALYSYTYVRNAWCMREWSLFRERVRWLQQATGTRRTPLIGIPWSISAEELPDDVRSASWTPPGADDVDRDDGLVHLLRQAVRRHPPSRERYQAFIHGVTKMIIEGAAFGLPTMTENDVQYVTPYLGLAEAQGDSREAEPPGPRLSAPAIGMQAGATHDARGLDRAARENAGHSARSPRRGVGSVVLVIAAGRADEQEQIRTHREYYGSEPEDWQPFRPDTDSPAAAIALAALSDNAIDDAVCFPIRAELSADLAHADAERRVVVVLVDPWIIKLDEYREPLEHLARRLAGDALPPAGAVVIFSSTDPETGARAANLDTALRTWMSSRTMNRRSRFGRVHTDRELAVDVVRVVVRTQSTLMSLRSPDAPRVFDTNPHRPILRRRRRRPGEAEPRQ